MSCESVGGLDNFSFWIATTPRYRRRGENGESPLKACYRGVVTNEDEPDRFVTELVNAICKDVYVWRMARAMVGSTGESQRRSAVARMRNAERRIRDAAFEAVEREQVRMAVED